MLGIATWFHMVIELLNSGDLTTATTTLVAVGGSLVATVRLVEADVTVEEALSYAGVLHGLGDRDRARELFRQAVAASLHRMTPVPLRRRG